MQNKDLIIIALVVLVIYFYWQKKPANNHNFWYEGIDDQTELEQQIKDWEIDYRKLEAEKEELENKVIELENQHKKDVVALRSEIDKHIESREKEKEFLKQIKEFIPARSAKGKEVEEYFSKKLSELESQITESMENRKSQIEEIEKLLFSLGEAEANATAISEEEESEEE